MSSAAADLSHGAEWDARTKAAPLNAMGANVTIQKNWQELIRPNKLQVAAGADPKREATLVAEPLERGFGVTSRIDVMVKPAACSARNADSRPEPGPATSTSRVRMPCSCAFLAASSAATCAA